MKITTLKQLAVLVEQKRSIYLTSAKKGFTPAAFVLAMPGHVIFNWMLMGIHLPDFLASSQDSNNGYSGHIAS